MQLPIKDTNLDYTPTPCGIIVLELVGDWWHLKGNSAYTYINCYTGIVEHNLQLRTQIKVDGVFGGHSQFTKQCKH